MINVAFLPAAMADYAEAYGWYYSRSQRAAAGFERAVEGALSQIQDGPERWAFCDRRHRSRLLKKYPYSIVYRVQGQAVLVVAVAHARRRFGYWQGRR